MQKSILITGGAGFIGSNFVPYFTNKYENYNIINLDKLTYAGNLDNLKECEHMDNYVFIKGDICDRKLIEQIFEEYDVKGVIHFAAESHVDNSILKPQEFVQTNVVGTFTLLDVAKNYWLKRPNCIRNGYENCRFHHISTDEVYGSLGNEGYFSEDTAYSPNSPYSASKASSDMFVRAYNHTYGLNTTISNCSNNYGPKQNKEKLIPKIILNALSGKNIPIYGDGKNIRDWLYVMDHCEAIDLIFHNGKNDEIYNIGGHNEKNNLEIVNSILTILDEKIPQKHSYKDLITFVEDRAGHDKRYAINATKLVMTLGWKAKENFDSGIIKTVDWYLNNR